MCVTSLARNIEYIPQSILRRYLEAVEAQAADHTAVVCATAAVLTSTLLSVALIGSELTSHLVVRE